MFSSKVALAAISLVASASSWLGCESAECAARDYGHGSTVCVCNATYCDTVEQPPDMPPRQYYICTSSKQGQRFSVSKRNFADHIKPGGVVIRVRSNQTYQAIFGFGGAITDSAGMNIHSLTPDAVSRLVDSYFSRTGIEYSFLRVPIGGTDFSTRKYTYADDVFDKSMSKFALSEEDYKHKIPIIKAAMASAAKRIKLLGAAWTAPPWMKTSSDYSGFGLLKEAYYDAWSKYHVKFLEEYDKESLRFWGLSTGNEPLNGLVPFFPFNCMGWTPLGQGTWVADNLGPALAKSKFNETLIIAVDDQRFTLPWWLPYYFRDERVRNYTSGIGVHWYYDKFIPVHVLDKAHETYPDKFILSTEACFVKKLWDLAAVELGSWSRGEDYAENIITDLNHWSAGWIDWNLALDANGGPNWASNFADAAIVVNATANEFYKQPMYYAVGHFSKFIPDNSIRIFAQSADKQVLTLAAKTPHEKVVLVVLNKKSKSVPIRVIGAPRGFVNLYLPPKSITTIVYKDKHPPLWFY